MHAGKDDGIEFFGGTASLRHAVISHMDDDSLDWDEGWSGTAQFVILQQSPDGDRAIEGDSLGSAPDSEPRATPELWNLTVIGSSHYNDGARLREGTAGTIGNALFTGYPDSTCVRVDGSASIRQANAGALEVRDSLFHGCGSLFEFTPDDLDTTTEFTGDWISLNEVGVDPQLVDPQNLESPNFEPAPGPPVGDLGADPGPGLVPARFVGALEPGCWDWTAGWTAYPPLPD